MPRDATAWGLMLRNAAKLDGACVLCYHGIAPLGWSMATQLHHIKPKQMGGTDDEFTLADVRNMAPACYPHHQAYQQDRALWVKHMGLPPLNHDYRGTPLEHYMEVDGERQG